MGFEIKTESASVEICAILSELLIEEVAAGGSVGFIHPLARETAMPFWDDALAAAARNERLVLGARDAKSSAP